METKDLPLLLINLVSMVVLSLLVVWLSRASRSAQQSIQADGLRPPLSLGARAKESFVRQLILAVLAVATSACTTTQEIRRPDGSVEYLVACGANLGWNICYDKANELCPAGYKTLSEDAGFNRKELRIGCPSKSKVAQ